MLQVIVTGLFLYLCITWFLRSLTINRRYRDLYVVITGCDSGFGKELAYRLDRFGFNVFAACLTEEAAAELERTTSKSLHTVIVDVSKPETISKLVEKVKKTIPNDRALWGIVNNAGISGALAFSDILTKEHLIEIFDVNLFGMAEMTKQFLPLLRKSKGRIINTSSVAGRLGSGFLPYPVSKFAVEGYSDCLRRELYHQGVSVHIIEPGAFLTPILKEMTPEKIKLRFEKVLNQATDEQREFYGPEFSEKISKSFNLTKMASKDTYKVVNAYFHALTARFPKARYVVGLDANIMFRFSWMCPEWMSDFFFTFSGPLSVKPKGLMTNCE